MSLIKCPECSKLFSEFAKECPNCGFPTSMLHKQKFSGFICKKRDYEIEDGVLVKYLGNDENVVIPDQVSIIGYHAFYNNEIIKNIVIGPNVKKIRSHSFSCCKANIIWNSPTIESFDDSAFAFYGGEHIEIPNSVKNLGYKCFYMSKIKKAILPGSIEKYGEDCNSQYYGETFYECEQLETIELLDGIKEIPQYFINNCNNLRNFIIPNSIESIHKYAFSNNYSDFLFNEYCGGYYLGNEVNPYLILCVCAPKENDIVTVSKHCKFIYPLTNSIRTEKIINGYKKYEWKNRGSNVKEFILSSNCKVINTRLDLFKDIGKFSITNNDYYSSIDGMLFYKADSELYYSHSRTDKSFAIPEGVKSALFSSNDFLEEIICNEELENIRVDGCGNVRNIIFNDKIKSISLSNCNISGEIYLPSFDYLYLLENGIETLYFNNDTEVLNGTIRESKLIKCVLPKKLKVIKEGFLNACCELKSLDLPNEVYRLERNSLPWGLNNFILPNSVCEYIHPIGPNSYSLNEYEECLYLGNDINPYHTLVRPVNNNIEELKMHPNCVDLVGNAFYGCIQLKSISFSNHIKIIPSYCFCGTGIEILDIPFHIEEIGEAAFLHCESLTQLTLHEGLIKIGRAAFESCVCLKEIIIPETVNFCSAFYNCSNIKKIILPPNLEHYLGSFLGENLTAYNEYKNGKYLGTKDNPYYYFIEPLSKNMTSFELHKDCHTVPSLSFYDGSQHIKKLKLSKNLKFFNSSNFSNLHRLSTMVFEGSNYEFKNVNIKFPNSINVITNNHDGKHPICNVVGVRFDEMTSGCYYYLSLAKHNLGERVGVYTQNEYKIVTVVFIKEYKEYEELPYDYFQMSYIDERHNDFDSNSNSIGAFGLSAKEFAEATKNVRRAKDVAEAVADYKLGKQIEEEIASGYDYVLDEIAASDDKINCEEDGDLFYFDEYGIYHDNSDD